MVVRGEGFEPSIFADVRQQKIFQALHHCAIPPVGSPRYRAFLAVSRKLEVVVAAALLYLGSNQGSCILAYSVIVV